MGELLQLPERKQPKWEKVGENLYRNTQTRVVYVRIYRKGKGELYKSTGETKIGVARTIGEKIISEWMTGVLQVGRQYTVSEVCDMLLAELEQEFEAKRMDGSRKRRIRTFKKDNLYLRAKPTAEELVLRKKRSTPGPAPLKGTIRQLFGDIFVDAIDEAFWKDWTENEGSRLGRNLFDIGKYLSKILNYAFRNKIITRKPAVFNPDPKVKKGRIYTEQEVLALFRAADQVLQDKWVLANEAGMRTHEVSELPKTWVRLEEHEGRACAIVSLPAHFVKTGSKTGFGREFMVFDQAYEVLRRRCAANPESPWLFPSQKDPWKFESPTQQSRRWRAAFAAAGIEGKGRFYDGRHTFFDTKLFRQGRPIAEVSEYAGNSVATLQKDYIQGRALKTRAVSEQAAVAWENRDENSPQLPLPLGTDS